MEHIIEIIKAIAWPSAAVWLGYIFKGEIRELLKRMSHFKYKDMEAKFEKGLSKIEGQAKEIEKSLPPEEDKITVPHNISIENDRLYRLSEVSSRAAVMEAWMEIESTTNEVARKMGLSTGSSTSPTRVVHELAFSKKIPEETVEVFMQLRELRNQAAHNSEFSVDKSETNKYIEMAKLTARAIKKAEI